mmetsp:Transcript_9270/g.13947  ORF Transcript_9270/g.13947 Transcript_9270/m.13947 type:complete len:242 (-) Transcript_9270:311-1036(-)
MTGSAASSSCSASLPSYGTVAEAAKLGKSNSNSFATMLFASSSLTRRAAASLFSSLSSLSSASSNCPPSSDCDAVVVADDAMFILPNGTDKAFLTIGSSSCCCSSCCLLESTAALGLTKAAHDFGGAFTTGSAVCGTVTTISSFSSSSVAAILSLSVSSSSSSSTIICPSSSSLSTFSSAPTTAPVFVPALVVASLFKGRTLAPSFPLGSLLKCSALPPHKRTSISYCNAITSTSAADRHR